MNISLPDNLQQFVLSQVAKGGYGSVSDYIGELVRADCAQVSLEAEIIRGIESGDSTPMTADDWNALHKRVRQSGQN